MAGWLLPGPASTGHCTRLSAGWDSLVPLADLSSGSAVAHSFLPPLPPLQGMVLLGLESVTPRGLTVAQISFAKPLSQKGKQRLSEPLVHT